MENKRLYRSCEDKIIGGVAGGLAEYLEIDSSLVRLIFLVIVFGGVGIPAYIISWVIIPLNPNCHSKKTGAEEIKDKAEEISSKFNGKKVVDNEANRVLLGLLLLAFGLMFLVQNIVGPFLWKVFWPGIIIVLGLFLILKSKEAN